MDMSKVQKCDVENCSYNQEHLCHALAITVGSSQSDPKCDTFFSAENKGGDRNATAGVGACKAADCKFNRDLECGASEISVGFFDNAVDCLTFSSK